MPKKKRPSPLYQRGKFWLDWDRRRDGARRSPFIAAFWYDGARGGNRSASSGTADLEEAKGFLDALYLRETGGQEICPSCHRPLERQGGYLVSAAIATYQALHATGLPSESAIAARLDHVIDYLEASGQAGAKCEDIDEPWIGRFRQWSAGQPILGPKGNALRDRALSTTEASVAQLSAALNDAHRRGNARHAASFKTLGGTNQTPQHRSDIAELAAMFRYCVAPDVRAELESAWGRRKAPYGAEELIAIRRRERAALHRFLIISLATICRPDAAHDFSTDPKRRQWNSAARILALNPAGRRQTKKYRAIVRVAWQVAPLIDAAHSDWLKAKAEAEKDRKPPPPAPFFVGPKSISAAWNRMAATIGLPGDREAGEKLIRRSVGNLVRAALPPEAVPELEMFMGHDKTDATTSLYAPFSPEYLRRALAAIEAIIDELEGLCPGAFSRTIAGPGAQIIYLAGGGKP